MTLTHTFTRTFNATVPASPYLRCVKCGARVEYWCPAETEIGEPFRNYPCEHAAGCADVCPSWGPVDGCQCREHLGYVPHRTAPDPFTEHGAKQGPL